MPYFGFEAETMKREIQAHYVTISTTQALESALQFLDLSNQDREKISGLGRAAASTPRVDLAI
jgi:hypothetical protein